MSNQPAAVTLPTAKIREPDNKLTLEEQLRVFEEWALWMFYLSCCPLEH